MSDKKDLTHRVEKMEKKKDFYHVALSWTGDKESAEDLAHDAVVKILENLDKFHGGHFKAWAFQILINILRNYKKKVQTTHGSFRRLEEKDTYYLYADESTSDPEINYDKKTLKDKISSLPEIYRSVVQMKNDGYSYKEIADKMGIPESTVKSRLNKGREIISREMRKGMLPSFLLMLVKWIG